MLEIRGLGHTYANGLSALSGVDLSIAAGEIVAVIGGSGCGKSTLLRLSRDWRSRPKAGSPSTAS